MRHHYLRYVSYHENRLLLFFFNFQVLLMNKQIEPGELDFLLRFPAQPNVISPVDFLSHQCWGGIKALSNMEQFRDLDKDIEVYGVICVTIITRGIHNYS